ncbi:uncharacterized protein LOC124539928 [Vanessa cardui]|uniref:uncharacterized protein LOC124539928 n=1 Tax=Vanessa cardui TaxID=171605 RepID=UPI001F1363AB|nr:uncharacterized protein LOC124539928 [Vanessa cardui]
MKYHMRLKCQTIVVLCYAVLSTTADQEYDDKPTKVWSFPSASSSERLPVINVTRAATVIPNYNSDPINARSSRAPKIFKPYAFRPRAIPLKKIEQSPQAKSVYYTQDNKYKTEILFPGNYFAIPKEKSIEEKRSAYDTLSGEQFEPKAIPLLRGQGFEKRSLDVNVEPVVDKSDEVPDQQASRRSLSYILGAEEDEDSEDEDGEYEEEDDTLLQKEDDIKLKHKIPHKIKNKIKKVKKYSKYMMPLLLAYKLKYFALIPVMIGGLVLLVGATGLAGFFFALFAAVMGLQKGGY